MNLRDPTGNWVEDVFIGVPSAAIGVWSSVSNALRGNWAAAAIDVAGVVADVAAIATPAVPGGAGLGIRATRDGAEALGDAVDAGRAARNASNAGRAADAPANASRAADVSGTGQDFDQARRAAFEQAGMTDPNQVRFTRADPKTGTITEFAGPNGASVGYDGPHLGTPGPFHDRNHVSWQTGGKRRDGGARRGNEPYGGPQHPSRLGNRDDRDIIDD